MVLRGGVDPPTAAIRTNCRVNWYRRFRSGAYLVGMGVFQRFRAWQACVDLTREVYRVPATWPRSERYELTAQLRRAAISAGANLAEGSAKRGAAEFARYLDIANGSLAETEHLLLLARTLAIATVEEWEVLEARRSAAACLTQRLYQAVRKRKSPGAGS